MGRHVYLSCGNASASATNFFSSSPRSSTNPALTMAADSLGVTSWARRRAGVARDASRAIAAAATTVLIMMVAPVLGPKDIPRPVSSREHADERADAGSDPRTVSADRQAT